MSWEIGEIMDSHLHIVVWCFGKLKVVMMTDKRMVDMTCVEYGELWQSG